MISKIRNQAEEDAASWYSKLRDSGATHIAIYKDRLDSLLSYQKKLHEIINQFGNAPELVIRAIAELQGIEISFHNLMKELPSVGSEIVQDSQLLKIEEEIKKRMLGLQEEPWTTTHYLQCSEYKKRFKDREDLYHHACLKKEEVITKKEEQPIIQKPDWIKQTSKN
jgi:hypothetical protein